MESSPQFVFYMYLEKRSKNKQEKQQKWLKQQVHIIGTMSTMLRQMINATSRSLSQQLEAMSRQELRRLLEMTTKVCRDTSKVCRDTARAEELKVCCDI